MKGILFVTASTLAIVTGMSAQAADLGGSVKDTGYVEQAPVSTRGGFYIRGDLGVANGDRDVSRTIDREAGLGIDTTGIDPAIVQDAQDQLAANGVNSRLNGSTLEIPLIGDRLGLSGQDDFSAVTFGGELQYLWRPTRSLGVSLAVGVTGYGDNETTFSHSGATGVFTGGTVADALGQFTNCALPTCAGDPSPFAQSGFVKFERDYDIDLLPRVHWFVSDRLALNAGVGLSFAKASFKGVNASDPGLNDVFGTAINHDDSAVGVVVSAGFDYWLTDRITFGGEANYKRHEFEAHASNGDSATIAGPVSIYGRSNDSVNIDDDVWTLKARVGIKLTD